MFTQTGPSSNPSLLNGKQLSTETWWRDNDNKKNQGQQLFSTKLKWFVVGVKPPCCCNSGCSIELALKNPK